MHKAQLTFFSLTGFDSINGLAGKPASFPYKNRHQPCAVRSQGGTSPIFSSMKSMSARTLGLG